MRLTLRLLSSVVQKRPFYITTPIFYVNAAPHIGHLYTALVADAIQRFEKLTNPDCQVIFSTGTDEHGTKIQQAAAKEKVPLPEYCAKVSNEYRELFKDFDIEYTDFIRTTEERHKTAVCHFWKRLMDRDYIYKANYSGWYSVNDEAFVPETHLRDEVLDGEKVKVSTESGHRVEWTEETNYMFRLSEFRTHLLKWLETDGVIRPAKYQQQLRASLERGYLPDLSVSRPASRVPWAIRVPGDEEQSVYVWLDALVNYLTVAGFPDEEAMKALGRPWPPDVQVVGKDILKFHGVYWPALVMAGGLHPPRRLLCHAHWTAGGAKMSKSRANVAAPREAPAPSHALRYLLLREATLLDDANYSETKLVNIANAELADTLGNLVSRCCGAALNPGQRMPALPRRQLALMRGAAPAHQLLDQLERLPDACHALYSDCQFHKVADEAMRTLRLANQFFESSRPWLLKDRPEERERLDAVLHVAMETLRVCAVLLQPMVPELAARLLFKLRVPEEERSWDHSAPSWTQDGQGGRQIEPGKFVLFQRIYAAKKARA
ncbi:unnamed protein product, partial [Iphiclides podalirius]